MTYMDTYRNTFFTDALELLGLVRLEPIPGDSATHSEASTVSQLIDLESSKEHAEPTGSAKPGGGGGDDDDDDDGDGDGDGDSDGDSDPFLVEFTDPNDPENPHNWPRYKTIFVVAQIMLLTCVTYIGSSIYTPGQQQIQSEFHVGHVVGTLNLSLYVLGYGLGPIFFSPLSEFAIIGRQRLYIVTLFLFTMLQIGCATVQNIAGLVILRFLTGFLCSPALATGGASIGDIVEPEVVPTFIGFWSIGAVAAPCVGPLLGAAMVVARDWRWIFWLLLWICAATFVLLAFFFPETSVDNILYRRCLRLRKERGDDRYYTAKEREEAALSARDIAIIALYRPFEIIVKEPIVLAFDAYLALCYGTFYLFFEGFPIVFVGIYNFSLVELGLAYMGFCVGCCFAFPICLVFFRMIARRAARGAFTPELFLLLGCAVCWCFPLSLFLFGWAASVHWTLPMLAEIFFMIAQFNLFQAIFTYLAVSYPKYLASVFAGNSVCRAGFACAFPLFGAAMYNNLAIKGYPVAWGSSLLGFFSVTLAVIPFVLYRYGPYLRSKSKFTG